MKEYEIYVPLTYNDGTPVDPEKLVQPLCANIGETLASSFITVEGQEVSEDGMDRKFGQGRHGCGRPGHGDSASATRRMPPIPNVSPRDAPRPCQPPKKSGSIHPTAAPSQGKAPRTRHPPVLRQNRPRAASARKPTS